MVTSAAAMVRVPCCLGFKKYVKVLEKERFPLIKVLLMDCCGPPTTRKPSKLGGIKLSPFSFITKSTRKRSLRPNFFLLTRASKLTWA